MCAFVANQHYRRRTFNSLNDYILGKLNWSFLLGYAWAEWLPQLGVFLVSLLMSKKQLLIMSPCPPFRRFLKSLLMFERDGGSSFSQLVMITYVSLQESLGSITFQPWNIPELERDGPTTPLWINQVNDFVLEEDQSLEITDNDGLKSMFEIMSHPHTFWIKVKVDLF